MPALRKTSTPLWREFEQLVARIEQVLAGANVKVTSPDRVRSLITGRKREVDASLRAMVGSSEVLITVECRRRKASQDITWIEQLGCKKLAIGAARTIAVASSSFSKDAIRAAGHYGIDLRVLSEIADAELQSWILPRFVIYVYKQCDLTETPEIKFIALPSDDFSSLSPMEGLPGGTSTPDSPVFRGSENVALTLNDLWLRADDQLKIFDAVPKDEKVHLRRLKITPSDELTLQTRLGLRRVESIHMALALRWKHERLPLSAASVVSYTPAHSSDQMHSQVRAEFESQEATNFNVRFGMQFQPGDDSASLTLELTPAAKN